MKAGIIDSPNRAGFWETSIGETFECMIAADISGLNDCDILLISEEYCGGAIGTVIENIHYTLSVIPYLLVGSFFACLIQFSLGKLIGWWLPAPSKGKDYQDVLINPAAAPKTMQGVSSITAGQAFGQKNTSLGVWMAQTYLDPLSALGAAAYILWQNIFNSAQLALAARKK